MRASATRMAKSWTMTISLAIATIAAALNGAVVHAESTEVSACSALEGTDFSRIPDATTKVTKATVVDADGEVPAHCRVRGYIAPQVGIDLRLPLHTWNGKFIEMGCGGFCGSTEELAPWCGDAVRRGYACIVTNKGHTGAGGHWAYNNLEAQFDFGIRAAHVAALAGKAITEHYYGRSPAVAYFMGCSGGGIEALTEAQRFPWDFDGIVAIDPSHNLCNGVQLTLLWNALATVDESGKRLFTSADVDVLHEAVLARCDRDDGVSDRVISNPPACQFDPAEIQCSDRRKSDCLSPVQVAAARQVYGGARTSAGERLFVGRTMPGSEKGGFAFATESTPPMLEYLTDWFRYVLFMPDPGPSWNPRDFDFDADYQRLGAMAAIHDADNPDLRRFKAAGGKLIIVQGWDDSGSPLPLSTIDYYQNVEKLMGGREVTQSFARLFMVPGRAHCMGGPGANAFDFLGSLEAWVEQGRAPDMLLGAHIDSESSADYLRLPADPAKASFTRPIYPYPFRAIYSGRGDPDDHRSFRRVEP